VIGDLGRVEVQKLCIQNGWACDPVQSDYGEDLMVQTQLDGRMDPFKIWIQVKGTENISSYRRSSGDYSYPISTDLALKWLRSREVVLLVLWDLAAGRGFVAFPRSALDSWQIYQTESDTVQLRIKSSDIFSAEKLRILAWYARVDHYTVLLRDAERKDLDSEERQSKAGSESFLIACDLLQMLCIADSTGLTELFKTRLLSGVLKARLNEPGRTPRQRLLGATVLATLNALHDREPAAGLSSEVLRAVTTVVLILLRRDKIAMQLTEELGEYPPA
jgi:hypothetical protein